MRYLKFLLLAGFLIWLPAAGFADSAGDNKQVTEQQLNRLKKNISELQAWLQGAKGKRNALQQQLRTTEVEIGRVSAGIRTVSQNIQNSRRKLQELQQRQQQLQAEQQRQQQLLARQIRAAYGIGRQEYIKVLLNQEQPEMLARALTYYDYFNRARTRQIDAFRDTLMQLQQTELAIAEETNRLQENKAQLEERSAELTRNKQSRHQVLLRLEANIENKDEELKKLLADRNRLEQLLEAVEQTLAELQLPQHASPIQQLKGALPWPANGRITRRFGSTDPVSNTTWNGILISASEGNEVKAVHHGRVVFADWLRGFGLLIIIDHGKGYMSLYGHNQTLYKETGDWVNANQVIASVGNSGGRQNAGLYFEIRHNGKPQNPQQWILARR